MDRSLWLGAIAMMAGLTYGATLFAAGAVPPGRGHAGGSAAPQGEAEAQAQPTTAPQAKAQANNRGYVVGKGGVARLRESGSGAVDPERTAEIGVNEPGVNHKTRGKAAAPIGVNEPGVNRVAGVEEVELDAEAPERRDD